jgi:hypothetical protein
LVAIGAFVIDVICLFEVKERRRTHELGKDPSVLSVGNKLNKAVNKLAERSDNYV